MYLCFLKDGKFLFYLCSFEFCVRETLLFICLYLYFVREGISCFVFVFCEGGKCGWEPFPGHATAFDESLTFDSCQLELAKLRLWKCLVAPTVNGLLAWLHLNGTHFVLGCRYKQRLPSKYKYSQQGTCMVGPQC